MVAGVAVQVTRALLACATMLEAAPVTGLTTVYDRLMLASEEHTDWAAAARVTEGPEGTDRLAHPTALVVEPQVLGAVVAVTLIANPALGQTAPILLQVTVRGLPDGTARMRADTTQPDREAVVRGDFRTNAALMTNSYLYRQNATNYQKLPMVQGSLDPCLPAGTMLA